MVQSHAVFSKAGLTRTTRLGFATLEMPCQVTHQLHLVYYWSWLEFPTFPLSVIFLKQAIADFFFLVICFIIKAGPSTGLDTILVNFSLYLNTVSLTAIAHWYFSSNRYNIFSFNKLFNSWHHSSFANMLCVVLHGSLV